LIKDSVDAVSIEIKQDIRYKKLILNNLPKNQTLSKSVAIIFYVARIRGLTRSILMIAQPFPDIKDYLKLSRFALISHIIKNYKIFNDQLLSRLDFEYKTFSEYSLFPIFLSAQFLNEKHIALYANRNMNIVFEKPIYKRYIFENYFGSVNRDGFAAQFVRWNSRLFIIFILRNRLQNLVDKFLVANYPSVSAEIKRLWHFQTEDHLLSSMTLDDVYNKFGFGAHEEILDVEILHQRFLKVGENILNLDATSSANQKFVAGHWSFIHRVYGDQDLMALVLPENNLKTIKEAIFLIGRCDENWYHFLLDTLPRLLFFERISQDVPLLIREDLPKTTKEFIRRITKRKVIELAQDTCIKITKLYVCPGRSTVFDSKPPKNLKWVEFSPIVLNKLREKIFDCIDSESHSIVSSQIMLSRDSLKRKLINSEIIERIALEHNFLTYDLNEDFFRRQIQIFSNAKHVISPGGAVVANILFMAPNTKITVLLGYGQRNLRIWQKLAQVNNLEYSEIKGYSIYWGFNSLQRLHSDFYISPRKLRRILSEEI